MSVWSGVAPSILSADFAKLGEQVTTVLDAGATVIHVDVMDGHFVPPLTMGPLVCEALAELVHDRGAVLDVHLMVDRPERHVEAFAQAGADGITAHVEATPHILYAVNAIKDAGCRAGVALNPGTPPEAIAAVADAADLVLCMTVNPGWGGQPFIDSSPAKIARLKELTDAVLEVDGGIGPKTAARCAQAGATLLVAGSAVFGKDDPAEAVRAITASATR